MSSTVISSYFRTQTTKPSSSRPEIKPLVRKNIPIEFRGGAFRHLQSYSLYKKKPKQQATLLALSFIVGLAASTFLLLLARSFAPSLSYNSQAEASEISPAAEVFSNTATKQAKLLPEKTVVAPKELKKTEVKIVTAVPLVDNNLTNMIPAEEEPRVEKTTAALETTSSAKLQTLNYKLERGDTLLKVWNKQGLPIVGALKAADALKLAGIPFTSLKPGDELIIKKDSTGDISELSFRLKDSQTVTLQGSANLGYQIKIVRPLTVTR